MCKSLVSCFLTHDVHFNTPLAGLIAGFYSRQSRQLFGVNAITAVHVRVSVSGWGSPPASCFVTGPHALARNKSNISSSTISG